jgi:hypothetical protein
MFYNAVNSDLYWHGVYTNHFPMSVTNQLQQFSSQLTRCQSKHCTVTGYCTIWHCYLLFKLPGIWEHTRCADKPVCMMNTHAISRQTWKWISYISTAVTLYAIQLQPSPLLWLKLVTQPIQTSDDPTSKTLCTRLNKHDVRFPQQCCWRFSLLKPDAIRTSYAWRLMHYDPLQYQEPLAQQRGVTSQKVYSLMLNIWSSKQWP